MYKLYLGGVLFPTPPKLTVKIKGQNKTMSLLDGGTHTFLRSPELTKIDLPLTLPMLSGEHRPNYYLSHLGSYVEEKKPIRFILTRVSPSGELLYDTNMLMSIEDYTTTEDAKNGLDVSLDISLMRYTEHKTITAKIETEKHTGNQEEEQKEYSGENYNETPNNISVVPVVHYSSIANLAPNGFTPILSYNRETLEQNKIDGLQIQQVIPMSGWKFSGSSQRLKNQMIDFLNGGAQ